MIEILMVGALALPMLAGFVIGATSSFTRPRTARAIVSVLCAFTFLSVTGLLFFGEQEILLPVWLPGTGNMSLHTGGVGSYAAVMITGTALLTVLVAPPGRPIIYSLLLVALAGANGALLAGHFLIRYVALETVGLCVAAAPIATLSNREGMQRTGFVYVLLRLGDAGLLTAILILAKASGSLVISTALAAGPELSGADLVWTVAGLALAVWVKCGIWPLHGWLAAAAGLDQVTNAWLYGATMQSLGLYLLYRVTPLMALHPIARWIIFGTALISIGVPLLLYRRYVASNRSLWIDVGSSLIGSVALCSAALGLKAPVAVLLLAAVPVRVTMALFALEWRFAPFGHQRLAAVPSDESSPFARSELGILRLAKAVRQRVEADILDLGVTQSWAALMKLATISHSTIEEQGFGALLRAPAQLLMKMSRWLQRRHTGQLRTHLRWIVVGFVLVVAVIVLRRW